MPVLQHWNDLPAEPAGPPVGKRKLGGVGASLVRVEIQAGTKAGRHSHDYEQFVQVVSGTGTLETDAGRQPFRAGSLFHFPAGTWHAAEFDEDTVLVETNLAEASA